MDYQGEGPDDINGGEETNGMGVVESGDKAGANGKFDRPNSERITTPYMTKYERARILGTRALQIRFVILVCVEPLSSGRLADLLGLVSVA